MLEKIVQTISNGMWAAVREGIKDKVDFAKLFSDSIENYFYDIIDEKNGWKNNHLMGSLEYFNHKFIKPRLAKMAQAGKDKNVYKIFKQKLEKIDRLKIKNHYQDIGIGYEDAVRYILEDKNSTHLELKKLLSLESITFNGYTTGVVEDLRNVLNKKKRDSVWSALVKNQYQSFDSDFVSPNRTINGKKITHSWFQKLKRNSLRKGLRTVLEKDFGTEAIYLQSVANDLNQAFNKAIDTVPYKGHIDLKGSVEDVFSPESIRFLTENLVQGIGEVFYSLKMGAVSFWNNVAVRTNLPIAGKKWKNALENIFGSSNLPDFEYFIQSLHKEKMTAYTKLRDVCRGLPSLNALSFAEQREAYRARMKRIHVSGVVPTGSIEESQFRLRVNEAFYVDRTDNHENYASLGKNRPRLSSEFEDYIFTGNTSWERFTRRNEVIKMNNDGHGNVCYKIGSFGLLLRDTYMGLTSSGRKKFNTEKPMPTSTILQKLLSPGYKDASYGDFKKLEDVYAGSIN